MTDPEADRKALEKNYTYITSEGKTSDATVAFLDAVLKANGDNNQIRPKAKLLETCLKRNLDHIKRGEEWKIPTDVSKHRKKRNQIESGAADPRKNRKQGRHQARSDARNHPIQYQINQSINQKLNHHLLLYGCAPG